MVLNTEKINGIAIVSLPEKLVSTNCAAFKQDMEPLMQENSRLVFDMTQLNYMDSSALGAVVGCLKRMREKEGDLKLFGLTKRVLTLFELVRMHQVFEIFVTRQQAVDSFD